MDQEETVCSVCGVSYLVFREIKALEKRIRSLEADMRDKDEMVQNAKTALEAATRSKSDADGIIANINKRCEQKLQSLRDEHAGAIRLACAEAEAAQRALVCCLRGLRVASLRPQRQKPLPGEPTWSS